MLSLNQNMMNKIFKKQFGKIRIKALIGNGVRAKDPQIKKQLNLALDIAKQAQKKGGRALLVGGFARDEILRKLGLKLVSKDVDLEVFGIEPRQLENLLSRFGTVKKIGASFGVYK